MCIYLYGIYQYDPLIVFAVVHRDYNIQLINYRRNKLWIIDDVDDNKRNHFTCTIYHNIMNGL